MSLLVGSYAHAGGDLFPEEMYSAVIGDNTKIHLMLSNNFYCTSLGKEICRNDLYGFYWYDKIGKKIPLTGLVVDDTVYLRAKYLDEVFRIRNKEGIWVSKKQVKTLKITDEQSVSPGIYRQEDTDLINKFLAGKYTISELTFRQRGFYHDAGKLFIYTQDIDKKPASNEEKKILESYVVDITKNGELILSNRDNVLIKFKDVEKKVEINIHNYNNFDHDPEIKPSESLFNHLSSIITTKGTQIGNNPHQIYIGDDQDKKLYFDFPEIKEMQSKEGFYIVACNVLTDLCSWTYYDDKGLDYAEIIFSKVSD